MQLVFENKFISLNWENINLHILVFFDMMRYTDLKPLRLKASNTYTKYFVHIWDFKLLFCLGLINLVHGRNKRIIEFLGIRGFIGSKLKDIL